MDKVVLRMAAAGEAVPFEIPGATGEFRIQILNEDAERGVVTSIVHLPPGGRIPAHFHKAGAEMHYVLEGDLTDGGQVLGTGAFITQAAGVVHGPQESRDGARVLTVQQWQSRDGSFDFHLAEDELGGAAPASGSMSGQPGAATQDQAAQERGEAKGYS